MRFNFELKKSLTDEEFKECFDFMKTYIVSLYGDDAVSDENYATWKLSRGEKENRFFIKIFRREQVCGYAEIMITKNETLYFCDIIIKEEFRRTTIVHEFVRYVLNLNEFKEFEEIYLHINKKNLTSYNTWKSLGLTEVEQGKTSNKYKISRNDIENYFNSSKHI